jgi:hypothetical protein
LDQAVQVELLVAVARMELQVLLVQHCLLLVVVAADILQQHQAQMLLKMVALAEAVIDRTSVV